MRTSGVLFAFVFLAVAVKANAQEPILVPTPAGGSVAITLPAPTVPAQAYTATVQPMVVPVPINLNVTPTITQRQIPVSAPAPTFPPQQPPQPAGQACRPIDPYAPIPFELLDGPITSTVLAPQGYMAQAGQPVQGNPFPAQPGQPMQPAPTPPNPLLVRQPVPASTYPAGLYAPRAGVYTDPTPPPAPAPAPLSVPAPGIPYSLDAQGRPQYVQQPQQPVGPQQWPGYTPVNYPQQQQQMPVPPEPRFNQPPYPYGPYPQDPYQPQPTPQPVPGFQGQYYSVDASGMPQPQQIAPGMNPDLNPELTNPNTPVQLVTPAQVNQAIMEGTQMVILDVRGELVRDVIGHVPNDVHVSLDPTATFPTRVRHAIPDMRFPVVVYCNDGINSSRAANILANMGYNRVYLMGIYTGWPGGGHIPPQACTSCLPSR